MVSMHLDDDSVCAACCNGPDGELRPLQLLIKEQDIEGHIAPDSALMQVIHDLPVLEAC